MKRPSGPLAKTLRQKVQRHPDGTKEYWRDAIRWPNRFRISSLGRIKSINDEIVPDYKIINSGYVTFKGRLMHRLMLETFIGPCPEGMECRHLDGSRTNNRLDNLEWGTFTQNQEDKKKHGTHIDGEKHYRAQIKNKDVAKIHAEYQAGATLKELYEKYGGSIKCIIKGIKYKTAQPENKATLRKRGGRPGLKNSRARPLTYKGETMTVEDWAKRLDLSSNTIRDRIDRDGWSVERALSTGRRRAKNKQKQK